MVGIVLVLLVACVALGQSNRDMTTRDMTTGIEGMIAVSPIRPGPIRAGSELPNAAPLTNGTFRVTSNEGVVTTFTTDTQGHFRVSLKPGHYSVLLAENRFPRPCGPFEIDVEAGKMTEVEWRCDSGMR